MFLKKLFIVLCSFIVSAASSSTTKYRYLQSTENGEIFNYSGVECFNLQPVGNQCPIDQKLKLTRYMKGGKEKTSMYNKHLCTSFVNPDNKCSITYGPNGEIDGMVIDEFKVRSFSIRDDIEFMEDEQILDCGFDLVNDDDDTNDDVVSKNTNDDGFPHLWEDCYPGINNKVPNEFSMGIVLASSLLRRFDNDIDKSIKYVEGLLVRTNTAFIRQLNIKLMLKHIVVVDSDAGEEHDWDTKDCGNTIFESFHKFRKYEKPSKQGLWHLIDSCHKAGNAIGVAFSGVLCSDTVNVAMTQAPNKVNNWITFAHEVGHNFGARHTFEEGQGTTGGIMDYGSGLLNNEYQFNKKYRYNNFCTMITNTIERCKDHFIMSDDSVLTCGNGKLDSFEECDCPIPGQRECNCCKNCKLKEQAQCIPYFSNECCNKQCKFEYTDKTCTYDNLSLGHCRNGFCERNNCDGRRIGTFCGTHEDNKCKIKCMILLYDGSRRCDPMNGWYDSLGNSINNIRDGAYCEENAICQKGVCLKAGTTFAPTPIPSKFPTPFPTPFPTRFPTPVRTKRPTPAPSTCNTFECPEHSIPKKKKCITKINHCKCERGYKMNKKTKKCEKCDKMKCPEHSVPKKNKQCIKKASHCQCDSSFVLKWGKCVPRTI